EMDVIAAWGVFLILARELAIAGWRITPNLTGNSDIKGANWWGKSKTVSQIIAIALLIAPLPSEYNLIAQVAFWLSVALTLISGVIYVTTGQKLTHNRSQLDQI
ncbi:MAG: CDP-alcohol phosphatidyltransferase family protein, partial [Microcystis panniformis]